MSSTRLLHVFSTFGVGGPQRRFAQIANALRNRYEHLIVAMDSNYAATHLLGADVPWTAVDVMAGRRKSIRNTLLFRRTIASCSPSVLVTYNFGATEWALANRLMPICRHIHIEDGFGPEEAHGQLPRRVTFRRIVLSGRHTTIIVPSEGLDRIAADIWRMPRAKVHFIPNGIDVTRFKPTGGSVSRSPADPAVVGTVCALRPEKNLTRLLQACAMAGRQRPLKVLIVGDGPERLKLEAESSRLGIADIVDFTGGSDRPEDHLARMDVFVLSSDTEQMPLGVLEAMATGLPVASTNVGDVARMLGGTNRRYVVPAGDTAALAAAIGDLCDSPDARAEVGLENLEKVRLVYPLTKMIEAYDRLFAGATD